MNREERQFIALLRNALWLQPLEPSLFEGTVDWARILDLAWRQTVGFLIADAIGRLPEERRPSVETVQKLQIAVARNFRQHAAFNQVLAEVTTRFRQNDIPTILLKGQGLAADYREPSLRHCGDIDLYVGIENYPRACSLADTWHGEKPTSETIKHYHFDYDGVSVELHRMADWLMLPNRNRQFQEWTRSELQEAKCRPLHLQNAEILLPSVNFNAVYVFNHLWHHFMNGGVGLRQLVDWVVFLHTHAKEIDRDALQTHLHRFGLWNGWVRFGGLAVDLLGLPAQEFPFYTPRYAEQTDKIRTVIFNDGNFGFYAPHAQNRPTGYLLGKLHSFRRTTLRYGRLITLFPRETLLAAIFYLYAGIRQLFIDRVWKR